MTAPASSTPRPRVVAFVWAKFAPYHRDRCAALAAALGPAVEVRGIAVAAASTAYPWPEDSGPPAPGLRLVTLVRDRPAEAVGPLHRLRRLWPWLRDAEAVFLCHYERPETLALALWLRRCGVRPLVLFDSTAADKPRRAWREALKRLWLKPYAGALTAGRRSSAYLATLGLTADRIATGYDTLDIARIRAEAGTPPAPDGPAHAERVFLVIARLVPAKNLDAALDAHARYAAAVCALGRAPRPLVILGEGPLRPALERRIAAEALGPVRLPGFRPPGEVARWLGRALALILPSHSEPWGLAVNEALALGVPVLVSSRAGAAADLVRPGVNGFVLHPDDTAGLAARLRRLDLCPETWAALARGAATHAPAGDVRQFVAGARRLLGPDGPAPLGDDGRA